MIRAPRVGFCCINSRFHSTDMLWNPWINTENYKLLMEILADSLNDWLKASRNRCRFLLKIIAQREDGSPYCSAETILQTLCMQCSPNMSTYDMSDIKLKMSDIGWLYMGQFDIPVSINLLHDAKYPSYLIIVPEFEVPQSTHFECKYWHLHVQSSFWINLAHYCLSTISWFWSVPWFSIISITQNPSQITPQGTMNRTYEFIHSIDQSINQSIRKSINRL